MFSSLIIPRAEAKPWRPKYNDREGKQLWQDGW